MRITAHVAICTWVTEQGLSAPRTNIMIPRHQLRSYIANILVATNAVLKLVNGVQTYRGWQLARDDRKVEDVEDGEKPEKPTTPG